MYILRQLAVAKHTCELFYEILCIPFRIVSCNSVKNGLIYFCIFKDLIICIFKEVFISIFHRSIHLYFQRSTHLYFQRSIHLNFHRSIH